MVMISMARYIYNKSLKHFMVVLSAPVEKPANRNVVFENEKRIAISNYPSLIGFGKSGFKHV